MITVTQSEVLAELQKALATQPSPDGYTTGEICDLTGWSTDQARKAIVALIREGKAKPVRVRRTAMDGRNGVRSGYQFILPVAKSKR